MMADTLLPRVTLVIWGQETCLYTYIYIYTHTQIYIFKNKQNWALQLPLNINAVQKYARQCVLVYVLCLVIDAWDKSQVPLNVSLDSH